MEKLAVAVNLLGPFCNCFFLKKVVPVSELFIFFFTYVSNFYIYFFIYLQILHNKSFGTSSPCASFAVILVQLIICERANHDFLIYSDLKKSPLSVFQ